MLLVYHEVDLCGFFEVLKCGFLSRLRRWCCSLELNSPWNCVDVAGIS